MDRRNNRKVGGPGRTSGDAALRNIRPIYFKRANAELPLIVGSMPVFSHRWGADKPFDQVVTEVPIGSGPYRVGKVDFGKDIEYVRDPNHWAKDLGVRKGMFNFDRITYKMYKDTTEQFEGFKAGEFDYIQAFVAREWARAYKGKLFDNGTLIKKELAHGNAGDFQGFMKVANANDIGDEYYKVVPTYLLSGIMALEAKPGSHGENKEELSKPTSRFHVVLRQLDSTKQYAVFLVRDDSYATFRRARKEAATVGFEVGWELLGEGEPVKFGAGGAEINPT